MFCVCVLMRGGRRVGYKVGRLEDPAKFKRTYCFYRLVSFCSYMHPNGRWQQNA